MVTLENPSAYEDERGNVIECGAPLGEHVTVVFSGSGNRLVVDQAASLGKLTIMFDCNGGLCVLGANQFKGTIRIGEESGVFIGDGVTCTAPCFISAAERASVTIGKDCMLASRNELRADDAHPIFSVETGARVNFPKSIVVGEHVWLAAGAILLGGAHIGDGCVVGLGSLVKAEFPNNCVIAGTPAKIVRQDIAWERPHLTLHRPYIKLNSSSVKKSPYWNRTVRLGGDQALYPGNNPTDHLFREYSLNNSSNDSGIRSGTSAGADRKMSLIEIQANGIPDLVSIKDVEIFRVDHSGMNSEGENLVQWALSDFNCRDIVVGLANYGFLAYAFRDGVTSFVHHSSVGKYWKRVRDGDFSFDENGLVYTLNGPLHGLAPARLVVIFSSMASNPYAANLARFFPTDFPDIQKHMAVGAAVLRIGDLGGVIGGYYMNTHAIPENERNVQALIAKVTRGLGLSINDVVLYGGRKGGAAALYHGLLGGFRAVAIDPVVSDNPYASQNDQNFSSGIFPEDRLDKLRDLLEKVSADKCLPISVVTSQYSQDFLPFISLINKLGAKNISVFNSRRVDIKVAPDVMEKTIDLSAMLLNMHLYRLPIPKGVHVIDEVHHLVDPESRAI